MPAKLNCPQKSSQRYSLSFNNKTDQEDETEGIEMEGLEMEGLEMEGLEMER
jgi:hypothetical protein